MMAVLEVVNLSAGYDDLPILWGINMKLEEGKMTCLVGGNGVGKTTVMRSILGLLHPTEGRINFRGKDITHEPAHVRAEQGLILVPEGRQLFTDMSVVENLEMGATPNRAKPVFAQNLEKVFSLFPRLKERRDQKAGTLSGGEQQMVAVARGIMAQPVVLMIDELSLGLAPILVIELFEALEHLKTLGITILLVEQNVQLALAVSDYGYVLSEGRIELEGVGAELAKNPHIRTAYLGM